MFVWSRSWRKRRYVIVETTIATGRSTKSRGDVLVFARVHRVLVIAGQKEVLCVGFVKQARSTAKKTTSGGHATVRSCRRRSCATERTTIATERSTKWRLVVVSLVKRARVMVGLLQRAVWACAKKAYSAATTEHGESVKGRSCRVPRFAMESTTTVIDGSMRIARVKKTEIARIRSFVVVELVDLSAKIPVTAVVVVRFARMVCVVLTVSALVPWGWFVVMGVVSIFVWMVCIAGSVGGFVRVAARVWMENVV